MYICLCNAIREKDLQRVIDAGATTVEGTFRMLECKPVCGRCVPTIEANLNPEPADVNR